MIPQGYEITGDMVPRVRNILGVPDRRDTAPPIAGPERVRYAGVPRPLSRVSDLATPDYNLYDKLLTQHKAW